MFVVYKKKKWIVPVPGRSEAEFAGEMRCSPALAWWQMRGGGIPPLSERLFDSRVDPEAGILNAL